LRPTWFSVGIYEAFLKHRLLIAKQAPHGAAKVGMAGALMGTAGALQPFGVVVTSAIATASATVECGGPAHLLLGSRRSYCLCLDAATNSGCGAARRPNGRLFSQKTLEYGFAIMLFVMAADLILKLVKWARD